MDISRISLFAIPLGTIIIAIIIGVIVDLSLMSHFRRLASKTKWEGDEILLKSLNGMIINLSVFIGIYFAALAMPINGDLKSLIQRGAIILIIFIAIITSARIARGFVNLYTRDALPSTSLIDIITITLVYILGILLILQVVGISIAPFLATLGVGGLAIALALQDTLTNLFSGLQIIAAKQLKIGDYIRLDSGEEGNVEDINWRNTTIRALQNNLIVVPNAKLASSIITNFNDPEKEMSVIITVGVSYDSDLKKVEKVTIDVAKEVMQKVEGAKKDFEPFIRYKNFGDSSIDFSVILRVEEFVSQYLIKHEFVKALHERFEKEGIDIPFPMRTVFLKNKEQPV